MNFKKRNIRLIAFDMDGTVLDDNGRITRYTIDVLNEAKTLGVEIVPNTGRSLGLTLPLISEIKGINYVISSNGAVITNIRSNTVIKECSLNKEVALNIYDLALFLGCNPVIIVNGYHFDDYGAIKYPHKFGIGINKFREFFNRKILQYGLRKSLLETECRIDQIIMKFNSIEEKYIALKYLESIDEIAVCYSHDRNLEITSLKATKGGALEYICGKYNISLENVMAIGDMNNDILMIKKAGIGVAMENSCEELKKAANYITLSNLENGAARAIEDIVLN